jgi:hypothetical protein
MRYDVDGLSFLDHSDERLKAAVNAEKRGCMLTDGVVKEEWWRALVRVVRLNLPPLTVGLAVAFLRRCEGLSKCTLSIVKVHVT